MLASYDVASSKSARPYNAAESEEKVAELTANIDKAMAVLQVKQEAGAYTRPLFGSWYARCVGYVE